MNTDKLIAAAVASEYAQTASRKVIALKKLDKRAKQLPKTISFVIGTAALHLRQWECIGDREQTGGEYAGF